MSNPIDTQSAQAVDTVDFLPIEGTDYVELYVSNALQAAHYYKTAFGFQSLAYRGLETGSTATCSYVLQQGKIRLVLTSPLQSGTKIGRHVDRHGDGVRVVALRVPNARQAFEETVKRGAKPFFEPKVSKDADGEVVTAGIHTYGETVHVFVERQAYNGVFFTQFCLLDGYVCPCVYWFEVY